MRADVAPADRRAAPAGGVPAGSSLVNIGSPTATSAEIYTPSNAVGRRWSGLLADSKIDRLAHSVALLTLNGEVLPLPPCTRCSGSQEQCSADRHAAVEHGKRPALPGSQDSGCCTKGRDPEDAPVRAGLLPGPAARSSRPGRACQAAAAERDNLRPGGSQVLVGGSAPTQDYRLQLYTPPYLTGAPNRPVVQSVTTLTPAYGAAMTLAFGWTNGTGTISRAVLVRQGGVSESMHFDHRQACSRGAGCSARPLRWR